MVAGCEEQRNCVGALIVERGRILLAHRRPDRPTYPDVWDIPGGHVEPGETDWEALQRELREELGIEVNFLPNPPLQIFVARGIHLSVWIVKEWTGVVSNRATDEHDDIRWVEDHQLAGLRLAHRAYRMMLRSAIVRDQVRL